MITNFKKLTLSILTMMMLSTMLTGVVFASNPLQDGIYTIYGQAVNSSTGEPSMADNAITKPLGLEVRDGKIFVIMEMQSSMYDLSVQNNSGAFELAEEVAENEDTRMITYRFPVQTISEPVLLETVVAAMGRKVNFSLVFDKTTLTKVTPNETTSVAVKSTSINVVNPQTGYNPFSQLPTIIFMAILISFAIFLGNKTLVRSNKN